MAANKLYEIETYEGYKIEVDEVIKQIEDCPKCGAKLILTHYSDAKNMMMQETSKCLECDYGSRDVLHILS
ncbi:hypothetical protein HBN50_11780 [Halobacteriovorax sp. GB3]|uniref:hypothetical protein n=1 Tax=Halobacteriovorax sp. GB3 TaxID=2719615 RepID=UPI002361CA07|nr:hypothetical protein [Halobacteriovorax sp. GB3]MDD0853781.1 hypothetical protein [Halobacteriovorax sp. GB3]